MDGVTVVAPEVRDHVVKQEGGQGRDGRQGWGGEQEVRWWAGGRVVGRAG